MNWLATLQQRSAIAHALAAALGLLVTLWAPTTLTPPASPLAPGPYHADRPAVVQPGQQASAGVTLAAKPLQRGALRERDESVVSPPPGQWHHPAGTLDAPVRPYDPPKSRYGAGHRGVDFDAPAGRIYAPADGTVSFVGVVVNRKVLTIDHGGGYKSSFEPVDTDLVRHEAVQAGAFVGTVGEYTDQAAHCPGSCFHWGVRLDGEYVHPLPLLGLFKPSVLLPLAG